MMKKLTNTLLATALALSMGSTFALAFNADDTNPNNDQGQAKAIANCVDNIAKQNANGQTGSNTGSANDKKQLNTAVTNCDQFWS
ncbi:MULTISPECIES: hypothetical protein [Aminobacter]|uniref:Secreted protein n=3 Tax=Aminobacter TaxID=31988 RepID=A0ABR6H4M3_AMIAI|nr:MULTISPECIES: hypothetical protein [Aminobacter]MBA8910699.1 hypothetical protein [Aminobacter ciceronei]MBA9024463.1 hypothetical protein [Aminobacter ciceronei]MBB3705454.1 hypothetical protein [Aminobacter aminovorans]QNH34136.1 hypothetical protein H5P29_27405 [Aminobacter sp. MDW-2]QNH35600.1 hypothetical protein H5P29_06795 [Aminobacter sp. MDW-2]